MLAFRYFLDTLPKEKAEKCALVMHTEIVSEHGTDLEAVRKIYLPLLQNLSKNADQPIIKWPDRGPVLKKQMDKLCAAMRRVPGVRDIERTTTV